MGFPLDDAELRDIKLWADAAIDGHNHEIRKRAHQPATALDIYADRARAIALRNRIINEQWRRKGAQAHAAE